MTRKEEIDKIYSLGITKKAGWQNSDNPILACDYGDLEKAWTIITTKMEDQERAELLEKIKLAHQAQSLARRSDRSAGRFVPQPKLVASWIRKKRWLDQIETPEQKSAKGTMCECGEVYATSYCPYCHSRKNGILMPELREWYKKAKKEGGLETGEQSAILMLNRVLAAR